MRRRQYLLSSSTCVLPSVRKLQRSKNELSLTSYVFTSPPRRAQVISHQTHLNNLLLNSTLLTQRPSSPPGGSNVVYLPPTTSGKRTRTANTSLATPARKEVKRKVANPDGGGRGGGKKDRDTNELLDEWYDHKHSPGKAGGAGKGKGGEKKKR